MKPSIKLKHKTRSTAVQMLKRIFKNTPEDFISLEGVFNAWGRDLNKLEENKSWFSNKVPHLKYHELVTPVYSYGNGPRRLEGIELTLEGKRELGRIGGSIEATQEVLPLAAYTNGHNSKVTLEGAMDVIKQLKEAYKDTYEITFDVKLKGI